MKRLITVFLILVMLISCILSVPAQAATINLNDYTAMQIIKKYPAAADAIEKGLKSLEDTIPVKEFELDQKVVVELYKSVLVENPEIFYVNPYSLKCSVSASTGVVVNLLPSYSYEKEEIPGKIQEFDKKVNKYLEKIEDDWSDYKKCRYLHDLIISNCEYDVDYKDVQDNIRTANGVFCDKIAVCQGYTLAYNHLLSKVGIEAHFVESYTVNHAWSMVKLNGKYYHVDVTWDDPTSDLSGRILHTFFLVSDDRLTELESIRKWKSNMKATDKTYDKTWLTDVRSYVYTIDGKDYYIDHLYGEDEYGALMCYDEKKGTRKCLAEIKNRWFENDEKINYWRGSYSCLAYDGNLLYFNTPTAVYSIKPDGTNKTKCYTNPSKSWKPIYGLVYSIDGKFRVEIQENPMSKNGVVRVISPKAEASDDDNKVILPDTGNTDNSDNPVILPDTGSTQNNSSGNTSTNKNTTTNKTTKKLKLKTPKVKITVSKKQIKIKYSKVSGAIGFQVKYKYKGKTTTKTYSTKKTATKTIQKLKKGTYKIYVRAYAKQGKKKVYSSWTKAKTIKIK